MNTSQHFRNGCVTLFVFFALFCFLKASSANVSQPVDARQKPADSVTVHRPRIEVVAADCAIDKKTNAQIIKGINFLYKFYETQFDYRFSPDMVIRIRVYEDFEAYKKYVRKVSPGTTGSNIGLYVHRLREAIVWKNRSEDAFLSTLFHETNHLLLRSHAQNCPKWINEGLSEYFERMDVSKGEIVIRPQLTKDEKIKKWLSGDKIPDMHAYLTTYNEDWDKENNQSDRPRALAWSLVYFLMSDTEGQAFIKNSLQYFSRHQMDKYATVRVMDTYYPGKQAGFEQNWLAWIPSEREPQTLVIKPRPAPKRADLKKDNFFRRLFRGVH